jgi:hypothetical protein
MKFDKTEIIAGVPVLDIRKLFRQRRYFGVDYLQELLALGIDDAQHLINALVEREWIALEFSDVRGYSQYMETHQGIRLAKTHLRPIKRTTAKRLIHEFANRAAEINRGDYAYLVDIAIVFGSYVTTEDEMINDVDIGFLLSQNGDPEAYSKKYDQLMQHAIDNGRVFRDFLEREYWPFIEVTRTLRGRSNAIDLVDLKKAMESIDDMLQYELVYVRDGFRGRNTEMHTP